METGTGNIHQQDEYTLSTDVGKFYEQEWDNGSLIFKAG